MTGDDASHVRNERRGARGRYGMHKGAQLYEEATESPHPLGATVTILTKPDKVDFSDSAPMSTIKDAKADQRLAYFIMRLLPRWRSFWAYFSSDGTMPWHDFRRFVVYECILKQEEAAEVFAVLDPNGTGFLRSSVLLQARRKHESRRLRYNGVEGLRKLLISKFGCVTRAWRQLFDKDNMGYCGKEKFIKLCRETGYNGDFKSLWAALAEGESAAMSHNLLCPEADFLLQRLAQALVDHFDTLEEGWFVMIRSGRKPGSLSAAEFEQFAIDLGFKAWESRELFICLGCGAHWQLQLSTRDFEFLRQFDPGKKSQDHILAMAAIDDFEFLGSQTDSAPGEEEQDLDDAMVTFQLTVAEHEEVLKRREALRRAEEVRKGSAQVAVIDTKSLSVPRVEEIRDIMRTNLHLSPEVDRIAEFMHAVDQDGTNTLGVSEMSRVFREVLNIPATVISDVELRSLVDLIDCDKSGEIDLGELLSFMLSHNAMPSRNAFRQVSFPTVAEVHQMQDDKKRTEQITKDIMLIEASKTCTKGKGAPSKKHGIPVSIMEKRAAAAAAKQQALKRPSVRAAETKALAAEGKVTKAHLDTFVSGSNRPLSARDFSHPESHSEISRMLRHVASSAW